MTDDDFDYCNNDPYIDGVGYCLIDVRGKPCGASVTARVWRGARDDYGAPLEPDDVEYRCCFGHMDLGEDEWSEVEPDEEEDEE